ncbi:hypothetical protein ACGC1H_000651 [Rhizoctonia solani]
MKVKIPTRKITCIYPRVSSIGWQTYRQVATAEPESSADPIANTTLQAPVGCPDPYLYVSRAANHDQSHPGGTRALIMGTQIYQSQYPSDKALEPGTYRILNARERTAIQVPEHNPTQIVAWKQHDEENQKWYLQRSGHGYQLQNRHYDAYLAVSNTDNGGLAYASRYPTTWIFLKYNENYIIQLADKNRVLDLHNGLGQNGNTIHIFHQDGSFMPHRVWKLERLRLVICDLCHTP